MPPIWGGGCRIAPGGRRSLALEYRPWLCDVMAVVVGGGGGGRLEPIWASRSGCTGVVVVPADVAVCISVPGPLPKLLILSGPGPLEGVPGPDMGSYPPRRPPPLKAGPVGGSLSGDGTRGVSGGPKRPPPIPAVGVEWPLPP